MDKVREFYAGIGKAYGIPSIDMKIRISEGTHPNKPRIPPGNTVEIYYMGRDKIKKYYLEEIDRFFFDVFGPEHRKDLEKQVEDKFQKMLADNPNVNFSDRIGMKMALRDALKNKKFEAMWKYQNDPAGWVARYINRVYISPIQLYEHIKSSDMFANLIASTIAHEIGHILGLERIDEEQDVERSNLMSTINQTATDDAKERIFKNKLVFNVNLTENQIRQINQHLKGE